MYIRNKLITYLLILGIFAAPLPGHAAVYEPGETLDPSCAPSDAECRVRVPLIQDTENAVTLAIASSSPGTTDNKLYNIAGVLYWNGGAVGGASGLSSLNGDTSIVQAFTTGTAGADFNISTAGGVHTFNLPTASASARGLLSSADYVTFNTKASSTNTVTAGTGLSGGGTLGSSFTINLDIDGLTAVTSVGSSDTIAIYDTSAGGVRKITRSDFLQGLTSALTYQGTWDASANSPVLADSTGSVGETYVAETTTAAINLGSGALSVSAGDLLIHNGSVWQVAPSGANVASVFGRTGAVAAESGDYTAGQITNVAAGTITATDVQGALNELDAEKLTSTLQNARIFIGDGTNEAEAVALFGDASLANTGEITILNADATHRGFVSTTTQTFAGAKTFTDDVTVSGTTTANTLTVLTGGIAINGNVPGDTTARLYNNGGTLYWDGSAITTIDDGVFLSLADWSATTTDALAEGTSNRYYATSLFAADLVGTTTDALGEGSANLYFTNARSDARFAVNLAGTTTDALAEGSTNLYWNQDRFDAALLGTTSLPHVTTATSAVALALNGFNSNDYLSLSNWFATTTHANLASLPGLSITESQISDLGNYLTLTDWFSTTTASHLTTLGTIATGTWQGDVVEVAYGGTGTSTYAVGDILYADSPNSLTRLPAGTNGQVLKLTAGVPSWGTDIAGGGGGSGLWATTSDSLAIFPTDSADVVVIGGSATTSTGYALEVIGASLFDDVQSATATTTSIYTTTLGLNNEYFTDLTGDGLLNLNGVLTLATSTFVTLADWQSTTTDALAEGSVNRYYASALFAADLAGTTTDALAEGSSNLYWTQGRFNTALISTSSLPHLTVGTSTYATTAGTSTVALSLSGFDQSNYLSLTDWFATTSASHLTVSTSSVALALDGFSQDDYFTLAGWYSTTTDALAEGASNFYWTEGRFDAALLGTTSVEHLTVGTSTYATVADTAATATVALALSGFNPASYLSLADWSATTTDALGEGSTNLYFTNARADGRIAAATSTLRAMLSAGTGLSYSSSTGVFTNSGVLSLGGLTGTIATSSLGIALSDTTGTLPVSRGGTGITNIANNAVLIGAGSTALATTSRGDLLVGNGLSLTGGSAVLLGGSTTVALDIHGLMEVTGVESSDTIALYDGSESGIRKITRANFLQGLTSALTYQGTWDANANSPVLTDASGSAGNTYVASTATTTLDLGSGALVVNAGDMLIHNGTAWQVAPSGSNVASVFGRTGAIAASAGDYTASQVAFVATSTIAATNVQAAIEELLGEGGLTSLNGITGSAQVFANDTNVTISSAGATHTFGWSGQLAASRGGTGLGSVTANQLLIGNSAGTGWTQLATSSLGLFTTDIAEGTNLYWTQGRFDAALLATSSLMHLSVGTSTYAAMADTAATATAATTAGTSTVALSLDGFNPASYLSLADWNATTTDALAEGLSNLYWTDERFDARLSATTTLPNLATLLGLTDIITTNATTTNLAASVLTVSGNSTLATTTVTQLLSANQGIALASSTPLLTTNTLYNQGGELYWDGSAVGAGGGLWTENGSDIHFNTGNVGIGATSPATTLAIEDHFYFDTSATNNEQLRIGDNPSASIFANSWDQVVLYGGTAGAGIRMLNNNTGTTTANGGRLVLWSDQTLRLWHQENQALLFGTNATERLRITGDGDVGIGAADPTSKLHVLETSDSATIPAMVVQSGGGQFDTPLLRLYDEGTTHGNRGILEFAHGSGGTPVVASRIYSEAQNLSAADGAKLYLQTASNNSGTYNANQLVLSNDGNVGIGTNAPAARLHVTGGDSLFDRGTITSNVTRSLTLGGARNSGGTEFASLIFRNYDDNSSLTEYTAAQIDVYNDGGAERGRFEFAVADGVSSLSTALTIDSDGSIGIGDTSPDLKLEVVGTTTDGYFGISSVAGNDGNVFVVDGNGHVGIGDNAPGANLEISNDTDTTTLRLTSREGSWSEGDIFSQLEFYTDDDDMTNTPGAHAAIRAVHTRSGSSHSFADAGLTFHTLDSAADAVLTERMRIAEDGKVAIGTPTTTASNALLTVAGNMELNRGLEDSGRTRRFVIGGARNTAGTEFASLIFENYDNDFTDADDYTGAQIDVYNDGGDGAGRMEFSVANSSTTQATALTIDSTGYVGVGTNEPATRLAVAGDLSQTPINPTILGGLSTSTLSNAYNVEVVDDYAYVNGASLDTLAIVDVSNPSNPTMVGSLTSPDIDGISNVTVVGRYAYVINTVDPSFRVIDISDPTNPTMIGGVEDSATLANMYGLDVVGTYAYVSSFNDDSFSVIDISDPTNPTIVGNVKDAVNLNGAYNLKVVGEYAYATGLLTDTFVIIDISNPTNPTIVGTVQDSSDLNGIFDIDVAGRYAYAANYIDDSLRIIDIADPTNPVIVGGIKSTDLDNARGVTVAGRYAYVAAYADDSLRIIDVADPTNPTIVAGVKDNTLLDGARGIDVVGRYAYVSMQVAGSLQIIDLYGSDFASANIGSLYTGDIVSDGSLRVMESRVSSGLNVGGDALFGGLVSASGGITLASTTPATTANTLYNQGGTLYWDGEELGGGLWTQNGADIHFTTGNVGIGTTTPATTLAIEDHFFFDTSVAGREQLRIGDNPSAANYVNSWDKLLLYGGANGTGIRLLNDAVTTGGRLVLWSDQTLRLWHHENQALVFGANNAEQMRITNTGNVGIGTDLPSAQLHVAGGNGIFDRGTDTSGITRSLTLGGARNSGGTEFASLIFRNYDDNSGAVDYTGAEINVFNDGGDGKGRLEFSVAGASTLSTALTIDSTGYVGIGDTAPDANLEISDATAATTLRLTSREGSWSQGDIFSQLEFYTDDANMDNTPGAHAAIMAVHTRAGTSHSFADAGLTFHTLGGTSNAVLTERMRIAEDGQVSIGTTTASSLLTVAGNATLLGGDMELNRGSSVSGLTSSLTLGGARNSESTEFASLVFRNYDNHFTDASDYTAAEINVINDGGEGAGRLDFSVASASTTLTTALTLDSTGYVGIGTTEPYARLTVAPTTDPTIIGGVKSSSNLNGAEDVVVVGRYAYVVNDLDDSLRIIDIADPTSPSIVGGIKNTADLNRAEAIAVAGHYAYVVSEDDDSLRVIDVSNPSSPTIVGGVKDNSLLDGINSVTVSGHYVYVTAASADAMRVIDVSDPTSPSIVGGIADGSSLNGPRGVAVSGRYGYVVNYFDDSLRVLDLGGAALATAEVGHLETSALNVLTDSTIANSLFIGAGLNVGLGGIQSDGALAVGGALAVSNDNSASYFAGSIGIGTSSPTAALNIVGGNVSNYEGLLIQSDGENTDIPLRIRTNTAGGASADSSDDTVFIVQGDGEVGIGVDAPDGKLEVRQTSADDIFNLYDGTSNVLSVADGGQLQVFSEHTTSIPLSVRNDSTSSTADGVRVWLSTSNPDSNNLYMEFIYTLSGSSQAGRIRGNGSGGVAYNTTSDRRIKDNIVDTAYGLSDVLNIQVRDYTSVVANDGKVFTGFVAQELYEHYPLAVSVGNEDEYWGVDYGHLTPLLTQGVQDLSRLTLGTDEDALAFANHTFPEGVAPALASLIATSSPLEDGGGTPTFAGRFFERLAAWFSDTTNTITEFIAGTIRARDQLCVGETCVSEAELQALLAGEELPVADPDEDSGETDDTGSDGGEQNTDTNTGGTTTDTATSTATSTPATGGAGTATSTNDGVTSNESNTDTENTDTETDAETAGEDDTNEPATDGTEDNPDTNEGVEGAGSAGDASTDTNGEEAGATDDTTAPEATESTEAADTSSQTDAAATEQDTD